ncbi:MAG: hypothetical protein ACJAZS_000198 [Alteromonas naphthalenivorans]|jgi:hypothetical protein
MKNKLMGALFAISMIVAIPVCAADVEAEIFEPAAEFVDTGDVVVPGTSFSLSGLIKWPYQQIMDLKDKRPFVSGVLLTAAVFAAIHYGTDMCDKDKKRDKQEDLF